MDGTTPSPRENSPVDAPVDTSERLAYLRLIRSENVGPVTFHQLLGRYGTGEAALAALPELARRGGRRRVIVCSEATAKQELQQVHDLGAELLTTKDPGYPSALAALPDAPPVLITLGRQELLGQKSLGIVGARNASANGRRLAQQIAADLGAQGFIVASGLARGIDAAAHRGAIESGTIAVVAGGVDVIYPQENTKLYEEIKERGLVISEMPVGTVPQARHFPRRNRLISGIAQGTLVVEAAKRSGSLITVRFALEQGREVFAIPGSPLDPRARGCNELIRQGAILVESAADIIDALEGPFQSRISRQRMAETSDKQAELPDLTMIAAGHRVITELLGPTPVAVDELVRQCQLSPAVVHSVLLELELAGRTDRHPGNRVALSASGMADTP